MRSERTIVLYTQKSMVIYYSSAVKKNTEAIKGTKLTDGNYLILKLFKKLDERNYKFFC